MVNPKSKTRFAQLQHSVFALQPKVSMTIDHQSHPVSEMGRNDYFYRFYEKHRSDQQPAAVLQSLPRFHPLDTFKPSWDRENKTKDNPKPGCQCPKDTQGAEASPWLTHGAQPCAFLRPAFTEAWLQLPNRAWCLEAHEAWHCLGSTNTTFTWGLAPFLCGPALGKYLAGLPRRGLGPLPHIPTTPVLGR